MFEFITNTEERGQVGIGTLIVFIAMVLVAAIAAGVLINTAGFLQTQAEETGQDSTDLVSERIDVSSEVGIVAGTENTLSEIRLEVTGAPGADQIDLAETTIQAVGPGGQENLVFTDNTGGSPFIATDALTANGGGTVDIATVDATRFVNTYDEFSAESDTVDVILRTDDGNNQGSHEITGVAISSLGTESFDIAGDGDLDGGTSASGALGNGDTVTLEITPAGESNTVLSESEDAATSDAPAIEVGGQLVTNLGANQFAVGSDGNFRSSAVLSDEDDFTILINPDAGAFDDGTAFGEGQSATLDIVSPAGATTQVELRAPDLFNTNGEAVRL